MTFDWDAAYQSADCQHRYAQASEDTAVKRADSASTIQKREAFYAQDLLEQIIGRLVDNRACKQTLKQKGRPETRNSGKRFAPFQNQLHGT